MVMKLEKRVGSVQNYNGGKTHFTKPIRIVIKLVPPKQNKNMTKDINGKEIKKGDTVLVEQAWEDESGQYHDEYAEIISIGINGELSVKFLNVSDEVQEFLKGMEWWPDQVSL